MTKPRVEPDDQTPTTSGTGSAYVTVSSSLASKALPTTRWWSLHLALAISCSDVEQPANALIAHFGNLRGILDAPLEELRAARRIGSVTPIALQIIRAAAPSTSSRERGPVTARPDPAHAARRGTTCRNPHTHRGRGVHEDLQEDHLQDGSVRFPSFQARSFVAAAPHGCLT